MIFIECGAYGKEWPNGHMFPAQTVQAQLDIKGKILHPIHPAPHNGSPIGCRKI
jgi:L-ascorbate metabolism protein UlaG (beta-lactamase superfamily)